MAGPEGGEPAPAHRLRAGRSIDQNALAQRVAPRVRAERLVRLEELVAERLRRHEEQAGDRIAALNHELRTPLSLVLGYTEMLLGGLAGPLTEEQEAMLRRVEDGSARLVDLVEQLLRISVDCARRGEPDRVAAEVVRSLGDPDASCGDRAAQAPHNGVPTLER